MAGGGAAVEGVGSGGPGGWNHGGRAVPPVLAIVRRDHVAMPCPASLTHGLVWRSRVGSTLATRLPAHHLQDAGRSNPRVMHMGRMGTRTGTREARPPPAGRGPT